MDFETVTGELANIIYQNETGFIIGSFLVNGGKPVMALGQIVNPQRGLTYQLTGAWVQDKKYGRQFKIKSFQTIQPEDTSGIYKFLVRTCKFVGPKVGQALVDAFEEKTLEVLKADPVLVSSKIKGLSYDRAVEIQAELLANEDNERVMVELWGMLDIPGMRKAMPGDLVERYNGNAAEKVRQNPYILTDFPGVGFSLADRVALNVGYPADGIERKKAAVLFCLDQIGNSAGDIWISQKELMEKIGELVSNLYNVSEAIPALVGDGKVIEEEGNYALAYLAKCEAYVARKIAGMVR